MPGGSVINSRTRPFYGAAIQGNTLQQRRERAHVHRRLLGTIKRSNGLPLSEHVMGDSVEMTAELMQETLGPLPPPGLGRAQFVREGMIAFIEGELDAAVFEVSVPSLGTGVEIAHAYLRPRLGLRAVPILCLYQHGSRDSHLSAMVRGVSGVDGFEVREYGDLDEADALIGEFVRRIGNTARRMLP